ncbi:hypothetical protein HDU77_009944 [Chytriomyces hyalinus]|nr:hypothetical protein HDU77_009944 [Chytriomyces hyalinus]
MCSNTTHNAAAPTCKLAKWMGAAMATERARFREAMEKKDEQIAEVEMDGGCNGHRDIVQDLAARDRMLIGEAGLDPSTVLATFQRVVSREGFAAEHLFGRFISQRLMGWCLHQENQQNLRRTAQKESLMKMELECTCSQMSRLQQVWNLSKTQNQTRTEGSAMELQHKLYLLYRLDNANTEPINFRVFVNGVTTIKSEKTGRNGTVILVLWFVTSQTTISSSFIYIICNMQTWKGEQIKYEMWLDFVSRCLSIDQDSRLSAVEAAHLAMWFFGVARHNAGVVSKAMRHFDLLLVS